MFLCQYRANVETNCLQPDRMATSHVGPQTRTRRTSMIQRSQTRAVKLVATLKIGAGSSEDQQILGHGQYWKDGASHCLTTCRTGVVRRTAFHSNVH